MKPSPRSRDIGDVAYVKIDGLPLESIYRFFISKGLPFILVVLNQKNWTSRKHHLTIRLHFFFRSFQHSLNSFSFVIKKAKNY